MKRYVLSVLFLSGFAFASDTESDFLRIAQGTKAIIDAGYDITNILEVDLLYAADFTTQHCVYITTEITPNPTCPDLFPQEKLSRGYLSCVDLDGSRMTSPRAIRSLCEE